MSLKLMLNCNGNVALHPDGTVPVLMESPCPFTPWTWDRTYIQYPDEPPTVTSSNPGMTLALSWTRTEYGSSLQNVTYVGKVLWDCTKSGLKVTAAFTGDNTAHMLVSVGPQLGSCGIRLNETDGLGPKDFAADNLYLRFSIEVRVTLRRATPGTATATVTFEWVA